MQMPGDAADAQRARLLWRCRRGTQELDLLLQRWLTQAYSDADHATRAAFEALLTLPDPQLAEYLLGGVCPTRADFAALVTVIRALPARSEGL